MLKVGKKCSKVVSLLAISDMRDNDEDINLLELKKRLNKAEKKVIRKMFGV